MKKFIYRYEAMSTPCELILFSDLKSQADSVANTILLETKRLEKKYNYYTQDSLLSQINNREIQIIDRETKDLLTRAKKYYNLTDGIFDITVATLKELYLELNDEEELQRELEKLKPFVGCEHFKIQRDKIVFDNPHTKIDLGGFVKEYSVDRAVKIVKKYHIKSALVNYGGDIYVVGKKPDGTKFSIGIKDPQNPKSFITSVLLEDEALTTSASYERNYTIGSQKYSHIIATKGVSNVPLSVSVISKNCVESGVFSTALMLDKEIKTTHKVLIF